jgi:cytochrome c
MRGAVWRVSVVFLLLCLALPVAGQLQEQPDVGVVGDPVAGRALAHKRCVACHDLTRAATLKLGPPLWQVVGRPVGSVSGFRYSADVAGQAWQWDERGLDQFLLNPKSMFPGTRMVFEGLADARMRLDLIAFLHRLR